MARECTNCQELQTKVRQLEAHVSDLTRQLELARRMFVGETQRTLPSLGPFGIIPNVDVQLQVDTQTCMYGLTGPPTLVGVLQQALPLPINGALSPVFPITLDHASRVTAHIPNLATHFFFVYPAFGSGDISPERAKFVDMEDPRHSFFMLGGFAYVVCHPDGSTRVLQCNAFARGADLCFGPHHRLPVNVVQQLAQQDRLQPVTVDVIKQAGAQYFAWLNPGEFVGHLPEPVPHGAFAYVFASAEQHRYFAVVPNAAPGTDRQSLILPFRLLAERHASTAPTQENSCSICMEKSPSVVFLPCRHLTCCAACSAQVTSCPQCTATIAERLDVYM